MNIDKFIFTGNVGSVNELKYLQSGQAVLSFSVAINRGWFDRNANEWKDRTQWVKCTIWGEAAERKAEQIKKGVYVAITGQVSASAYTNKSGEATPSLDVRVDDIDIIRRAANGEEAASDVPAGEPAPAGEGVLDF